MELNYSKGGGLIPAIIQDADTHQVLMLGYMNEEAFEKTQTEGRVTFFSRTKNRLWTKGETSGNYLEVQEIIRDCDGDALLIKAFPTGPVCHTGQHACFGGEESKAFLYKLETVLHNRMGNPNDDSYTVHLFNQGMGRVAQKVGEEATEAIVEALIGTDEKLVGETSDLLYHLLLMLNMRELSFEDVERELRKRHEEKK